MLGLLLLISVVQGLTEFLPISSSGHLGIISHFFQFETPQTLLFFLVVHAGTACSAIYFFRQDIYEICTGLLDFIQNKSTQKKHDALRWVGMIIAVSIPTAIVGLLFKDLVESIPSTYPIAIPIALLATALILFITKIIPRNNLELQEFTFKKAFLVGIAQSIALLPGISRSGSTISVALILGASPKFAGKLSFLSSFVAIFGALLLEVVSFLKTGSVGLPIYYFILGFITAFLVGLWALKFLIKILNDGKLYLFSIYCLVVGLSLLLYYIF